MSKAEVDLRELTGSTACAGLSNQSYAKANVAAINRALDGRGPDSGTASKDAGARMVINISSVHIPAFCQVREAKDKPYKNGYDLRRYRVGDNGGSLKTRELVDEALPLPADAEKSNVYFGALEMSGTGIRFYGDLCMVLHREALCPNTVVLDRNSYDLARSPLVDMINEKESEAARCAERRQLAGDLSGTWLKDLSFMVALRVFRSIGFQPRRCTIGQIAAAICNDEDYVEILKIGSFGSGELQEVRISSNTAAADALTGDRVFTGPPPRFEALMWRERRAQAEAELRKVGVRVVAVTTVGRTRD